MRELIRTQQLFKSYGNGAKRVDVLREVDLTFSEGEKAAIVGDLFAAPAPRGPQFQAKARAAGLKRPG